MFLPNFKYDSRKIRISCLSDPKFVKYAQETRVRNEVYKRSIGWKGGEIEKGEKKDEPGFGTIMYTIRYTIEIAGWELHSN